MKTTILVVLMFAVQIVFAQYPPLELSVDQVGAYPNQAVEVSVRAGNNFQNITALNGTLIFDPLVIQQPMLTYWGLSHPAGASFANPQPGVLTYDWTSLITIGPTLSVGDVVYTLSFDVSGGVGSESTINLDSIPTPLYWENGFGWSGNNFSVSSGMVTVIQHPDLIFEDGFEN
ncbi:MAG: hypothetical protein R3E90_06740 [Marinicella sp.]